MAETTLIDVDEEALAAAARELGTATPAETINQALREVGARRERMAALDRLLAANDDLGDPDIMAGAWR